MLGLMSGSWCSGRLAGRLAPGRTIAVGYLVMGIAASLNLALNLSLPPGLPWSVAPLFVYTLGMSLRCPI